MDEEWYNVMKNKNVVLVIFFAAHYISDKLFIRPPLIFFACQKYKLPHSKQIFNSDQPIFNALNLDRRGG